MAGHHQRSYRYSGLRVTVKHETDERLVKETSSNSRTSRYHHPTVIYYNSNHRQKPNYNRSSNPQCRSKNYDRQQQPLRPLMEIPTIQYPPYQDLNSTYIFKQKPSTSSYRHRKADLDWDHTFDLDQIDLYSTQTDSDNYSLASMHSSSDNSFSSV